MNEIVKFKNKFIFFICCSLSLKIKKRMKGRSKLAANDAGFFVF